MASNCDFAVVFATYLNTQEVELKADKLSVKERVIFHDELLTSAEEFWRSLGLRRIGSSWHFGLAKDLSHPSRSLSAADGYKRPLAVRSPAIEEGQLIPYSKAMLEAPYGENLEQVKARLIQHPATDETWLAVDRHGNNLVHVVAKRAKLQSLLWLADLPFFPQLLTIRNLEGETPLETLEASLESRRTMKEVMLLTVPVADSFGGYAPSDVQCLLVLKGIKKPTAKELAQLTCGCTCGHCIGGFISPRIALALECQGEITGDMLNDDLGFGAGMDGAQCCRWHDHRMSHLEPRVRQNLETNKLMRKGFGNLFFHTAKC